MIPSNLKPEVIDKPGGIGGLTVDQVLAINTEELSVTVLKTVNTNVVGKVIDLRFTTAIEDVPLQLDLRVIYLAPTLAFDESKLEILSGTSQSDFSLPALPSEPSSEEWFYIVPLVKYANIAPTKVSLSQDGEFSKMFKFDSVSNKLTLESKYEKLLKEGKFWPKAGEYTLTFKLNSKLLGVGSETK